MSATPTRQGHFTLRNMHSRDQVIAKDLHDIQACVSAAWDHLQSPNINPGTCFECVDGNGKAVWFGDSWDIGQARRNTTDAATVDGFNTARFFGSK